MYLLSTGEISNGFWAKDSLGIRHQERPKQQQRSLFDNLPIHYPLSANTLKRTLATTARYNRMKPFRNSLLIAGAFLLQLASASFILTQNDQGAQIACCPQGNDPASPDCCDAKHHQPGSDKAGYRCCSLEQFAKSVVCGNLGKIMVDGECVCPSNMIEDASGICQVATPAPSCESGLHEGKYIERCFIYALAPLKRLAGTDDLRYRKVLPLSIDKWPVWA